MNLDNVPAGVSPTHDDNIIYDIALDANGACDEAPVGLAIRCVTPTRRPSPPNLPTTISHRAQPVDSDLFSPERTNSGGPRWLVLIPQRTSLTSLARVSKGKKFFYYLL